MTNCKSRMALRLSGLHNFLPQSGIEAPDGDAGASYQAYNSN
ncbi:hypothetical protein [Citrobacter koseri]